MNTNKIVSFAAPTTDDTTGMLRVFINGTAFYTTDLKPYDLMAQRGTEVKFIQTLNHIPYNERELRQAVASLRIEKEYLDVMFVTDAAELHWSQQAV